MSFYPDDMDPECVPLCDALNMLPGIRTTSSCCGHGEREFTVFFAADTVAALVPIANATSSSGWHLEVWRSSRPDVHFVLVGKAGAPDQPGGADDLASWLAAPPEAAAGQFGRER